MISLGGRFVGDFGANGLHIYSQIFGWKRIAAANPSDITEVDVDKNCLPELAACFPGWGVTLFDDNNGSDSGGFNNWARITADISEKQIGYGD